MEIPTDTLFSLVGEHGSPLYASETAVMARQLAQLRAVLPQCGILYSMKTNPHPEICAFLAERAVGVDAASRGEVARAHALGLSREDILYSAPGKTDADLAATLEKCTIIADSYAELQRLDALCAQRGLHVRAGLRISPDFAYGPGVLPDTLPGIPDKFGEPEEDLPRRAALLQSLRHVRVTGFHVYVRSQVLHADALAGYFRHVFALAQTWEKLGLALDFVNLGGGFGVPYGDAMRPFDHARLGAAIADLHNAFAARHVRPVRLYAESGRYLVAAAGTFVTRIVDVKTSRGTTFVIAPGILNGFLRPAVAGLFAGLPQGGTLSGPLEPFWSGHGTYIPTIYGQAAPPRRVTVCGNLCTSLDTACRDVLLENVAVGNLLAFANAGAYAAALSPWHFSSHEKPAEVMV